jgi:thioredoxin-related protein
MKLSKINHLVFGLFLACATPSIVQAEDISEAVEADEAVDTEGASVGRWTMDFEAAKKIAAEKDLPLMLNFTGSDWCGWCKLMDKEVFAKEPWKRYAAEKVLLVTIDFPRDKSKVPQEFVARNKALKAEYGVRGYPTYVVLDSDGKTKIGQLGAGRGKTPESFIAEFEKVARNRASTIEDYAKQHPDKAEAYQAARANLDERKKALSDWLETHGGLLRELATLQKEVRAAEEALSKF